MTTRPIARRVTATDIARSLGISRATVGFVLNNTPGQTISSATRDRVRAEAARLGYRPHLAARALASGRTNIVLMVLPDWPIEHNLRANLDEATQALDEAGYSLVPTTPHPSDHARPLWETLQPDLVLSLTPLSAELEAQIRSAGARLLNPKLADEATLGILEEFGRGPALQVAHLIELGHKKIRFASTSDARLADLTADRERTAREASTVFGADFDTQTVDHHNIGATLRTWHEEGVTAVAAYNDDIAALVVSAAVRQGLPVPGRLAVIGHDDSPLARLTVPALSTVRVDTGGVGRYMAALALREIGDVTIGIAEPPPMHAPQIVIRESTVPVKPSSTVPTA
ncbi:LacI family DNA-binding transcriptional regulator [Rhodococcus sp. P1Y]|uniref:LacI family DNA-binding transcriptional regulator n=1 Tax=Rhodococcus sp. P1Y TaxID=1302308 RepID=UPI000EB3757E|nr:LacI family DNA-binding transcriptional regulator [Rhodococcus sp. P1Y]AYJ48334.1 LacI family transcriptional regulator [Rhodococcus sp. P1Y]